MAQTDTEVVICGAGATGLTLAIELARRGIRFRVLEKASGPFRGSRGKGLQPRSLEVFEDLGVLERLIAIGAPYPWLRIHRGEHFEDRPFHEVTAPTPSEPYTFTLMVPQFATEGVLRERLAELGGRVEWGSELIALTQDQDGVTAHVRTAEGESLLRASYLVAADGGKSFVRHALEIGFPGESLPVRAVVADLTLTGLSRDRWHFWGTDASSMLALCPLPATDLFQLQAAITPELEANLRADTLAAFITQRTQLTELRVGTVSWFSTYGSSARLADRYRVERVLLAGDAAHVHPPTGGQGLNTSVQDAYNLGWKLAAVLRGAPDALLNTYEAERREVAASVLGLSTRLLETARAGGALKRDREVQQLDLQYRDSALSLHHGAARAVLAGDRAPDAPCRSATGHPLRLFERLHGGHWTLLQYEVDPTRKLAARAGLRIHRIGPTEAIRDEMGHIREAYGLQAGDQVLVRPDGYIAATVSSDELMAVADYLDRWGIV